MNGVDVRAPIEHQRDDVPRAPDHRAVKRQASHPVAVVHERRIGIEEGAHAPDVAGLCGEVDLMIGVRL